MARKPTGYGPGRPRKGEIRPPSPTAVSAKKSRDKKIAADPEGARKIQAERYRKWYYSDVEHARRIGRNAYRRKVAWANATHLKINDIKTPLFVEEDKIGGRCYFVKNTFIHD